MRRRQRPRPKGTSLSELESPAGSASRVAGIVLAAGASRRLGRPKQLLRFEGRTLVERAADLAIAACDGPVLVVVGAHADEVVQSLGARPLSIVRNERWEEGMGRSLTAAIAALPAACDAVLVLLCDQPKLRVESLRELVARWRAAPDRLVASAYREALGVPAVFPRRLFASLAALAGDAGARRVIAQEGARALRVEVPEAAFDVDDEAAAAALVAGDR